MCIQLNPSTEPMSTPGIVLANPPKVESLPSCLKASARFDHERSRLIEAELCLRAATCHAENARWCDMDAAIQLAEQQISRPFQLLLWADECHTESTGGAILNGEEVEAMTYFIGDVVKFRRERRFPYFAPEDCDNITRLLSKYAPALAEKRGIRQNPESEPDDHNFLTMRRLMLAANAEPVRAAE